MPDQDTYDPEARARLDELEASIEELEAVNEALASNLDEAAYYLAQTRFALESMFYVFSAGKELPWEELGVPAEPPVAAPEMFVPQPSRAERRRDMRETLKRLQAQGQ